MRYLLSVVLGAVGLWLILLNWRAFYITYIKKEKFCSWIPLLPGITAIAAFLLFPDNRLIGLFWIGFFLDWGCVPGLVFTLLRRVLK
ncbi:MAG: hypothetical protein NC084_02090 [Bacteroides sp.]|nr:hypothetical protein [Eubacterium sp.]MCM1417322.1 hypothetical protein [Roseburia sp.]MCM1461485.1 hypothetical protein [Bacteroides sp.]